MSLSPIVWALAGFGMTLGISFALAIRWDIHLAETGQQTISEFLLRLGYRDLILVLLIVAAFCITFGGLAGHLWWPKMERHAIWPLVLVVIIVFFPLGMYIGHRFFGQ